MRLFEEVLKQSGTVRLREMAMLGKLRDLEPGKETDAYETSDSGEKIFVGHPVIPKCFANLKNLIPDSNWWWINSGSNQHNIKGSTAGAGSFQFDFFIRDYFHISGYYDPMIGFTKININYDDVFAEIKNPISIRVEDLENFISSNLNGVLSFILQNFKLSEKQVRSTLRLLR
jgi:hypothetical protein